MISSAVKLSTILVLSIFTPSLLLLIFGLPCRLIIRFSCAESREILSLTFRQNCGKRALAGGTLGSPLAGAPHFFPRQSVQTLQSFLAYRAKGTAQLPACFPAMTGMDFVSFYSKKGERSSRFHMYSFLGKQKHIGDLPELGIINLHCLLLL